MSTPLTREFHIFRAQAFFAQQHHGVKILSLKNERLVLVTFKPRGRVIPKPANDNRIDA